MNDEVRSLQEITESIKAEALRLGFDAFGAAPAAPVDPDTRASLAAWLDGGMHAGMDYLAGHFEKRCDPTLLVDGACTVISVALNYYPREFQREDTYRLAWYAYGEDYHTVMKEKLTALLDFIRRALPDADGRVFCDTAPVLERYWAQQCGLGWIGKHTQLILPRAGSSFFLGEVIINRPLAYNRPHPDRCGTCTRCLDACPTRALRRPFMLDARRCLSYLTIENRGDIPQQAGVCMGRRIYGCDTCQQVCPWTRFAIPTREERFKPQPELLTLATTGWEELTVERYRALFKGSAVKRAKYDGLMRNIQVARQNQVKPE